MCQSRLHLDVEETGNATVAVLDADGVRREVSLLAYDGPPPVIGTWLVVHSGYALASVDGNEAQEALAELSAARTHDADGPALFTNTRRLHDD